MSKKEYINILPISKPSITSWPWHAALSSIIDTYANTKEWILSNYIRFMGGVLGYLTAFDFLPRAIDYLLCPFINAQVISRDATAMFNKSIKDIIISAIDNGMYVFTIINTQYANTEVSGATQERFAHEVFIYGYNLERNTFYIADFVFKGRYSFEEVSIDAIVKGYQDITAAEDYLISDNGGIVLMKFEDAIYHFDKQLVKSSLKNYIFSGDGIDYFSHVAIRDNSVYFEGKGNEAIGIDAYRLLYEHITNLSTNTVGFDRRVPFVYFEHKKLMQERVQYMVSKNILDENLEFLNEISNNARKAETLLNKYLKCKIRPEKPAILSMIDGYKRIEESERLVYPQLIDAIN
jgi:hypothetical protein